MVEWLGLQDGERVLEPSAGHGAISRFFSPNTQNTIIEPSSFLSPLSQLVTPDAKVVRGTFEDFNIINKFEGIAMNPPFGTGGKVAIEHLAKAFKHLPSVAFERAGTSVKTKILIIDKLKNKQGRAKISSSEINFSGTNDINKLFDIMEHLEVSPRVVRKNPFAEVERDFPELSTKNAKNGKPIYYIDDKRVAESVVFDEGRRQVQIKGDVLFDEFREKFGVAKVESRMPFGNKKPEQLGTTSNFDSVGKDNNQNIHRKHIRIS